MTNYLPIISFSMPIVMSTNGSLMKKDVKLNVSKSPRHMIALYPPINITTMDRAAKMKSEGSLPPRLQFVHIKDN